MAKIRIKTDFIVRWGILTRGEAISLEGRDLRLEMNTPAHTSVEIPFSIDGNVLVIRVAPEVQTQVGVYSFTLWENHAKAGQTPLDRCSAFCLVSKSCKADMEDDNIEVEPVLELDTDDMSFAPISVGGGTIEIDAELSLESENAVQNKVVTKAVEDAHNAADSAMEIAVNAQAAAEDAQESADGKQDKISDLDAIRSGAAKGATALQEHQDISGKLDKTEAAKLYQPKGDYQPVGNYQPAGDYATSEALQNEITRATSEEKNIRALAEANKQAIENLAGSGGGSGGGSVVIVVDPALSETSENTVQNKAVTAGINEAKAAAQAAQTTANEAKDAAGTAEQSAKDYTDDQLKNYAKTEDLPNVPTKVSELDNDAEYITSADIPSIPDVSGLATKEEVSAVEKKIPIVPTEVSSFNNDAGYQTSNDVQAAIKGKANTSDVPTKVSELTNDSGFITAAQVPDVDTSNLATKAELAAKQDTIADLATIREGAGKGATAVQPSSLAKVATSGSYNDLSDKPTIPTTLAGLTGDSTHRTVTDTEKATWNAKSNFSGSYNDLTNKPTIPAAVTVDTALSATSTNPVQNKAVTTGINAKYTKPSTGIPESDLAAAVRTSLGKADTALQTEQYKGTVTKVKINGTEKTPDSDGMVDLGTIEGGSGGSSVGGGAYTEVSHGTGDTTFELTSNTFHVWDEVASLTLTLGAETAGVANEYLFQFTSGATATTLTLPDDIKWANGVPPTIAENMIYQVSVLKGMASVLEFGSAPSLIVNKVTLSTSGTKFVVNLQYAAASNIVVKVRTGDGVLVVNVASGQTSGSANPLGPMVDSTAYIESVTPEFDSTYIYTK